MYQYQVVYDHKVLKPLLMADDAIYWAERIGKLIPRRSTQIIRADEISEDHAPTEVIK